MQWRDRLPIGGQAAFRVGHRGSQQERGDARQSQKDQQHGQAAYDAVLLWADEKRLRLRGFEDIDGIQYAQTWG